MPKNAKHDNMTPFLVPVGGWELQILTDALSDYAVKADQAGDGHSAAFANSIKARALALQGPELERSRQAVASMGIGFARGTYQG